MQCNSSNRRIAIVGGGISGIACSWKLRGSTCSVDIYEAAEKLGGHANSAQFSGRSQALNVDTGFIAFEEVTYPKFTQFLGQLEVASIPTDMSFGVSTAGGRLEWGSHSIRSFFGTLSNIFSPWYLRMAFDFLRFCLFAPDLLHESARNQMRVGGVRKHTCDPHDDLESIRDYLRRQNYSEQFLKLILAPMVAAPWCIDPDDFAREFPAVHLIHFMEQHGLLNTVARRLKWRSFKNGSRTYVEAFQSSVPDKHRLLLSTPVEKVCDRSESGASLILRDGTCRHYDHIVLAVHVNQALALLQEEATPSEHDILTQFKTTKNTCYLHSDASFLPKREAARMAWNCLLSSHWTNNRLDLDQSGVDSQESNMSKISITFDMNKLQAIPNPGQAGSPGRVLVTMNPPREPHYTQSKQIYYHPLINANSIAATRRMHEINGVGSTSFAGAWMGYGFHEDGFASGEHAANILIHGNDAVAPLRLIPDPDALTHPMGIVFVLGRFVISVIQALL